MAFFEEFGTHVNLGKYKLGGFHLFSVSIERESQKIKKKLDFV